MWICTLSDVLKTVSVRQAERVKTNVASQDRRQRLKDVPTHGGGQKHGRLRTRGHLARWRLGIWWTHHVCVDGRTLGTTRRAGY